MGKYTILNCKTVLLWFSHILVAFIVGSTSACNKIKPIPEHTIFRYNEFRNITSLDPAFARNPQNIWPINQLFNGLVQLDNNLNIQGDIAQAWDIDAEGLLYTFYLRSDVQFHAHSVFGKNQTRKVIASDFTHSFDRLLDPEVGSPGGWVLQHVDQYRAVNDSVFEIRLKQKFPAFLGILTMQYCAVVPQEATRFFGKDFGRNPVGTGPFRFQKWQEEVKLILRKNHHYFETDKNGVALPYLEAVAINLIPDIQSEFMLFTQGKLDFLNSIDSSYKDNLLTADGRLQQGYKNKVEMQKAPYLNTEYIGINMDTPNLLLQSQKIRRALAIGFDRKKMITYLRNSIGYPANGGFIPKGLPGYHPKDDLNYSPEEAKALVTEFHEENPNIPLTFHLATDSNYLDLCEFLQSEWSKLGLEIKIDLMPTATLRQAKTGGKLEAFRASWIADYPDAENYLSLFFAENFSPAGPNYTHYSRAGFDSLYHVALATAEPAKRIALYQNMDHMIMNDLPVIPLYYDQAIRFTQKSVRGLKMNPTNLLDLKTVYKKP